MKIRALDLNNNVKEYDVILTYFSEEFDKDYVVYTDNNYEADKLKIYISNYNKDQSETIVRPIDNNEEYEKVLEEVNTILLNLKKETELLENNDLT